MQSINLDTTIKLPITKLIIVIGALLSFGFTCGSMYSKLTYYEQKIVNIDKRLAKIEKLIQSKQYYGNNEP